MSPQNNALSESGPDQTFQQHLKNNQFSLPKCNACKQFHFFPRVVCPHCGGFELEWSELSGLGEVYSTTTIRRKPERGGDYNVCLITLDEGPRMMSRVEGVDASSVKIGDRVTALINNEAENSFIVFNPARGRSS